MKQVIKPNFIEILRNADHKATPARLLVLGVLEKSNEPLSAYQVIKKLDGKVNQVTVYRILEALTKSDIIRRVDFQHSHSHYELTTGGLHHHHLVCGNCGKVEDVDVCDAINIGKNILKKSKSFASIKNHSLEFFGLCNKCEKQN